jgi:hypothetical protein
MATLPPEPILPARQAPQLSPAVLAQKWAAIHADAARLNALARIAPESEPPPITTLLETARDWQCTLAAQGIEDIEAMLVPGLSALSTLGERGQDCASPALALWREFHAARASVLAVLRPIAPD